MTLGKAFETTFLQKSSIAYQRLDTKFMSGSDDEFRRARPASDYMLVQDGRTKLCVYEPVDPGVTQSLGQGQFLAHCKLETPAESWSEGMKERAQKIEAGPKQELMVFGKTKPEGAFNLRVDLFGTDRKMSLGYYDGLVALIMIELGPYQEGLREKVVANLDKRYAILGPINAEIDDFNRRRTGCVAWSDKEEGVIFVIAHTTGMVIPSMNLIYADLKNSPVANDLFRKCAPLSERGSANQL
jgi:hypothetical protein